MSGFHTLEKLKCLSFRAAERFYTMAHDCSELTPVRVYEVWPHMRDNAKPLSENDAWKLLEARTYCPPSKAHVKRLKRPRPLLSRARPAPERLPNTIAPLLDMAREAKTVARNAAVLERHLIAANKPIVPDTHKPASPTQGRVYHAAKDDAWPTMDELNAKSERLAREHEQAVRRG